MDRWVTPHKRVTSPTWGPPPLCKQAIIFERLINLTGHFLHTGRSVQYICSIHTELPTAKRLNFRTVGVVLFGFEYTPSISSPNSHVIVSCDQLGETYRATPTLLRVPNRSISKATIE